ncbi:MAG: hypothetical protein QXP58_08860, partial [Thermoprotei archaeon]
MGEAEVLKGVFKPPKMWDRCVGFTLIFAKRRRLAVVGVDRKMGLESGMGLGANTGLVYPP